MDIDCLLLAGGSSKRMGEPKMLLDLGGRTLFEHVLASHIGSSVRRICAVVPGWLDGFEPIIESYGSDRVDFVSLVRECEMSESLKAGYKHVAEKWRPDAVMVSLADKPLVTREVIDEVIDGYAASGCKICVPVFDGRWGHPVILSAELESEIYRLEGDHGARRVIEDHRNEVAEVSVQSDVILVDVDTYDDLGELRRRLNHFG